MILISGANGQLGRAVLKQLATLRGPSDIVAMVRDKSMAADLLAEGFDVRAGDYDDLPALDRAMAGVEKVLLVSGTDEANRVRQHGNVVDAAKRAGVTFIAYTSRVVKSQDVSDNPLMAGHFATEDVIKASGLTYVLLRNALYMDVIPLFVGGDKVYESGIALPTGDGRVSFALRRELGEAIANLLVEDSGGSRVIALTSGEAWSFGEVASALADLSGRAVTYTPVDEPAFLGRMRGRGVPEPMARRSADFLAEIRNNRLDEVGPELQRLLGRKPASLKEGLRELFHLPAA